jgi:hypothetical protein
MKSFVRRLGAIVIVFGFGFVATSAGAEVSGKFGGMLEYTSSCSGQQPSLSGKITGGRVIGMAPKGQKFDWELADDGTFGGELFLRKHRSGNDKMQWYKGKVEQGRVTFKAEYGVVGLDDSFCYAKGSFELK